MLNAAQPLAALAEDLSTTETTPQQEQPLKTLVLAHADTVQLLSAVTEAIQGKQSLLETKKSALKQAQKDFARLKRLTTQQSKQAEIEEMQVHIADWQQQIEQMEQLRERLLEQSGGR